MKNTVGEAPRGLAESESRLSAIAEAFDGLMYMCSGDYRIEYMNTRFKRLIGGSDPIGKICYQAIQHLEKPCPWCVNDRVFAGETAKWEVRLPLDERYYSVVNQPITHPDGSLSKLSMAYDITERKEAEDALRQSEERYRRLVEAAPEGIAVHSGGVVRFVNPAGARILGAADASQVVGRDYLDFVVAEEGVPRDVLLRGRTGNGGVGGVADLKFLRLDRGVVDVELVTVPFIYQGEDATQVLFRDVTERRRAAERVKESEARLRDIINNTNAYVYLKDLQGRFLLVNQQFAQLFGVTEEDLVGRKGDEVFPSERATLALEEKEWQVLETGKPIRTEESLCTPLGPRTYASLTFPLHDASKAVYAICGVSTDITDSKLAEQELKKKDRAIRQAYVDVIAAVTGNKLILMMPDEIADALGEPVMPSHSISSYRSMSRARAEILAAIAENFPALTDLDEFIIGVGEGLTNVIKHAGRGRYDVRRHNNTAQVVISDKGPGVDFTAVPRATLEVGFSTQGTLGVGFTIMLEMSDRVRLSTQAGETVLVLELSR